MHPAAPSARVLLPWLAAVLLAACSSVPLPPDPATSGVRAPAPPPSSVAPPAAPAPPPAARALPLPSAPTPPSAPSLPITPTASWPPVGAQPAALGTNAAGMPLTAWRVAGTPDAGAIVVVVPPGDSGASVALAQAAQRLAAGAGTAAVWLLSLTEPGSTARAEGATPEYLNDHLLLRSPEAAAVARLVRDRMPFVLVQLRTLEPWIDTPAAVRLARSGTPALHEFTRRAVDEWLRQPALDALTRDGVAVSAPTPAPEPGGTLVDAAALRHVAAVDVVGSAAAARGGALAGALVRLVEAAARRAEDFDKVHRYVDQEVAARPCGTQAGAPLRACGWWLAADAPRALSALEALGIKAERVRVNETRLGQLAAPGGSGHVNAAIDLPAGSVYVPASQPLADLAAALLEPASPTGLLAAGLVAPAQLARIMAVPSVAPAPAPSAAPASAPGAPADGAPR